MSRARAGATASGKGRLNEYRLACQVRVNNSCVAIQRWHVKQSPAKGVARCLLGFLPSEEYQTCCEPLFARLRCWSCRRQERPWLLTKKLSHSGGHRTWSTFSSK